MNPSLLRIFFIDNLCRKSEYSTIDRFYFIYLAEGNMGSAGICGCRSLTGGGWVWAGGSVPFLVVGVIWG